MSGARAHVRRRAPLAEYRCSSTWRRPGGSGSSWPLSSAPTTRLTTCTGWGWPTGSSPWATHTCTPYCSRGRFPGASPTTRPDRSPWTTSHRWPTRCTRRSPPAKSWTSRRPSQWDCGRSCTVWCPWNWAATCRKDWIRPRSSGSGFRFSCLRLRSRSTSLRPEQTQSRPEKPDLQPCRPRSRAPTPHRPRRPLARRARPRRPERPTAGTGCPLFAGTRDTTTRHWKPQRPQRKIYPQPNGTRHNRAPETLHLRQPNRGVSDHTRSTQETRKPLRPGQTARSKGITTEWS